MIKLLYKPVDLIASMAGGLLAGRWAAGRGMRAPAGSVDRRGRLLPSPSLGRHNPPVLG